MKLPQLFRPLTVADKFRRMAKVMRRQADDHAVEAASCYAESRRLEAQVEHHAKLARILAGEAKILEERSGVKP